MTGRPGYRDFTQMDMDAPQPAGAMTDEEFSAKVANPQLITTEAEAREIIRELQQAVAAIAANLEEYETRNPRRRDEDWASRARFARQMTMLELDRVVERELELRGVPLQDNPGHSARVARLREAMEGSLGRRVQVERGRTVAEASAETLAQRFMAFARERLQPQTYRAILARARDLTSPTPDETVERLEMRPVRHVRTDGLRRDES